MRCQSCSCILLVRLYNYEYFTFDLYDALCFLDVSQNSIHTATNVFWNCFNDCAQNWVESSTYWKFWKFSRSLAVLEVLKIYMVKSRVLQNLNHAQGQKDREYRSWLCSEYFCTQVESSSLRILEEEKFVYRMWKKKIEMISRSCGSH